MHMQCSYAIMPYHVVLRFNPIDVQTLEKKRESHRQLLKPLAICAQSVPVV